LAKAINIIVLEMLYFGGDCMGFENLGLLFGLIGILLLVAVIWAIINAFIVHGVALLICAAVMNVEHKFKFVFRYVWGTFGINIVSGITSLIIRAGWDVDPKSISTTIIYTFLLFVVTFFAHWLLVFRKQEDKPRNIMSLVFAAIPVAWPLIAFLNM
jgi:hypothetical protein